jgi:hypothetical protein
MQKLVSNILPFRRRTSDRRSEPECRLSQLVCPHGILLETQASSVRIAILLLIFRNVGNGTSREHWQQIFLHHGGINVTARFSYGRRLICPRGIN